MAPQQESVRGLLTNVAGTWQTIGQLSDNLFLVSCTDISRRGPRRILGLLPCSPRLQLLGLLRAHFSFCYEMIIASFQAGIKNRATAAARFI